MECITLKEERKIEEAPGAYKDIGPVINSQVEEGLVNVVAIFSPLVTFKAWYMINAFDFWVNIAIVNYKSINNK